MKRKTKPATLALLFLMIMLGPMNRIALAQQRGPAIDILRIRTVKSPDARLFEILTGNIDSWTTAVRPQNKRCPTFAYDGTIPPKYIEIMDDAGLTIMATEGFNVAYFVLNIRPDQTYRGRPDVGPFLGDVDFRHALFHLYNRDEIIPALYKYTVQSTESLVPPAQGGWHNPAVPSHPYDPDEARAILEDAGYHYDPGINNWRNSLGYAVPEISVLTPTYEAAATEAAHGARFVKDCNDIGLSTIIHEPIDFHYCADRVFHEADFDICFMGANVDRFPDFLYNLCHSSQDSASHPGRYNAAGLQDTVLDSLLETLKTSLDHDQQENACFLAQERLNREDHPQGLAYLTAYSKVCFSAFREGVYGIVDMYGFGADNSWTMANLHWRPDAARYGRDESGNDVFVYCNGEEPESLNPCYAHTVYAWNIINNCFEGLLDINPYTREDIPALADDWSVDLFTGTTAGSDPGISITDGMTVTFFLNDTATWQDGKAFTAEDVQFNWLFMRDNMIPRYMAGWEHLVSVEVVTSGQGGTVKAYLDVTGYFYLCDLAGMAALLHPTVWAPLDGDPLVEILAYDPTGEAGHNGVTPTNLIGTGPFVFGYYDPVGLSADMTANRNYWQTTDGIHTQKVEMFHACGDVDYDGVIGASDLNAYGLAFGTEPPSNPDADLNGDGRVDGEDGAIIGAFMGEKREYPEP